MHYFYFKQLVVELHIYISSVEYNDIDFRKFSSVAVTCWIWSILHLGHETYKCNSGLLIFIFLCFCLKFVKFYRLRAINFLEFIFALPIRSTARHIFLQLLNRKLIFSLGHSKEFEKFLTYKYLYSNRNTKMFFFEFFFF